MEIDLRSVEIDLRGVETDLRGVETDLRTVEIALRSVEIDLRRVKVRARRAESRGRAAVPEESGDREDAAAGAIGGGGRGTEACRLTTTKDATDAKGPMQVYH